MPNSPRENYGCAERIAVGERLFDPAELDRYESAVRVAGELLRFCQKSLVTTSMKATIEIALADLTDVEVFLKEVLAEWEEWTLSLTGQR